MDCLSAVSLLGPATMHQLKFFNAIMKIIGVTIVLRRINGVHVSMSEHVYGPLSNALS